MGEKKIINIFTDGGARGNPGPAAIGVVVKDEKGNILHKIGKLIGVATNNVAEYRAVIEALIFVKDKLPESKVTFYLDSKLIASQLAGLYKVKSSYLRELVFKIRILEQEIGGDVFYQAVPREKNKEADRLVNFALNKMQTR